MSAYSGTQVHLRSSSSLHQFKNQLTMRNGSRLGAYCKVMFVAHFIVIALYLSCLSVWLKNIYYVFSSVKYKGLVFCHWERGATAE